MPVRRGKDVTRATTDINKPVDDLLGNTAKDLLSR
jgi:hypothetical protein